MWGVVLAVGGAAAAFRMLCGAGPTVTAPWERTNHAGMPVTLLEGPAFAVGAALGAWQDPAALVTIVGSSAVGALDDLKGGAQAKGLRGHLRAASRGQVTTGVIKIGGLALTGVAAAMMVAGRRPEAGPRSLAGRASPMVRSSPAVPTWPICSICGLGAPSRPSSWPGRHSW